MRKRGLAVLGLSGAGGAAVAAVAGAALLPIADRDAAQLPRSACRTWFVTGGDRYFLMSAGGLAVRVNAGRSGLHRCPLTPAQTDEFAFKGMPTTCGGRRLTLRHTGPETNAGPGRAVGADATLTVERGGRATVLTGRSETECGGAQEDS